MAVMITRRKEKRRKARLESRKTGFMDKWAIEGAMKEHPGSSRY
jgi:hypothetical protein